LSYTIENEQSPFYISQNVVSIPGYEIRDTDWLSDSEFILNFPNGYDVSVDTDLCVVSSDDELGHVICQSGVSSQPVGDKITFEVSKPAEELELLSDPIPMQAQDLRIRVRYVEGEEAWSQKIVKVLSRALPVLEQVMGFQYPGSGELEVVMSMNAETFGYAGFLDDEDTIHLRPSATRFITVHEGAHLWSGPFDSVWLTEGWAEWAARETVRQLQMDPGEPPDTMPRKDTIKRPLQDWQHVGVQTDEAEDIETYGYAKSYTTIARLVKLVGLKQLQAANRAFADTIGVNEKSSTLRADSYSYFEQLLKQVKNKKKRTQLRRLWKNRVLNDQGKALLGRRGVAWKDAETLRKRIEPLGWEMPISVMNDFAGWHFYSFGSDLRDAEKVLDVWEATIPLLAQLDWQSDDLVQRWFETAFDWRRTEIAATYRLELAQRAVELQQKLETDTSLNPTTVSTARDFLQQAGQTLQAGNSYRADDLVSQARELIGLSD
ncbi:MAG: M1 family metallopeptidase, partial [Chloroflexi bacterium]|nr:M1 family metallopeptidase [Chloroflexota bacterium]